MATAIDEIRYSHSLLKPIYDSSYEDVADFYEQAEDFLVKTGVWERKNGSIDEWDQEWDIELHPILWRARYIHSFDELLDLYQAVCTIKLGIHHENIMWYSPALIWKKISSWKSIKWTVNP
jgi:hypothetical protein